MAIPRMLSEARPVIQGSVEREEGRPVKGITDHHCENDLVKL